MADSMGSVSPLGLWPTLVTIGRRRLLAISLLMLVLVIATIPARVVSGLLPSEVVLEGFSGTVWQGEVARARLKTVQGDLLLGRVTWALDPLSVLLMAPTFSLDARWGVQQLTGEVTLRSREAVVLREVSARVDTRIAKAFIPLYIGGSLSADIRMLRIDAGRLSALEGRLNWQDAVWTARSGDVTLGNYVLDVSDETGDIRGEIVTLSGPLTVAGELALLDQRYRVALSLSGPATSNPGLRDALALIAVPTVQGFDVNFEGALPVRPL